MGYMADGYLFIVGRAKDMIIINGKNHWPQDIEWAVEQLPGFNHGDIAAFAVDTDNGEEAPAVLVHCRVSDPMRGLSCVSRSPTRSAASPGMSCVVELVPPRTLPRTSSGKLSRAKAKKQYLAGEIVPLDLYLTPVPAHSQMRGTFSELACARRHRRGTIAPARLRA